MNKPEKIKILYVDDELNNLTGFKASFRIDYDVFIANDTLEAFSILTKNPDIRIIFCDQNMPDKTGVQFFEEIRSSFPYPIRILLTGYADIEAVIDAINRGNIFRYVKKPWTDTDITSAIEESNKFYMVNSMLSIKNEELQKAYNELDKFAHSVTHDMRGPLLSILGAIDVAQHINDIDEIKDMLGMMDKSVKKLDVFIQNIHDYYNIKRGELQISEIDFVEIVKDHEDIHKIAAKINNTTFTTKVTQNEPFRSDEMSISVILNNLLSNAFKYQRKNCDNKFVNLDIDVTRGLATIEVKDNGIGIDNVYVDEIFNMFFRATSEEVGSGIGLYNVKDALLKINGDITVDSKEGVGTTFKITIPTK